MKNIFYEFNGEMVPITLKSQEVISERKMNKYLKTSLKFKFGSDIYEYLNYLGYDVERCRICREEYPPVSLKIRLDSDDILRVDGFDYSKKVYCYTKNKDCEGKNMNSNSFEFISRIYNVSLEEAKAILKQNNKSPFYKENWSNQEDYSKFQTRNFEYFFSRFGEDAEEKYEEYKKKISLSNTIQGYMDRYGEEKGKKKYRETSKLKDSMSFNYFLKKNNNDSEKASYEYEQRKKQVSISLESLIERHGYEKAIKFREDYTRRSLETFKKNPNYSQISKNRAPNLQKYIDKFGEEEGKTKYYELRARLAVPMSRASKESLLVFNPLYEFLVEKYSIEESDIYLGHSTKNEFFIRNGNDIFFYDFTIRSHKIIIEFNGIAYHPKNENSDWMHPFTKQSASEIYKKQQRKLDIAKSNGYRVLEIWSDDTDNLEKCLKFIKNILDNDN